MMSAPNTRSRISVVFSLSLLVLLTCDRAAAKQLLSADQALALAFPHCEVTRETRFLSAEQQARANEIAGMEITSALVYPYRATCDGQPAGVAYFDIHRVRTLPERIMIVVNPRGEIARIEVLTFDEPQDYLPRASWHGQFIGKRLTQELRIGRDIANVAGATLSGRAVAAAVRRVLAVHHVLQGEVAK